MSWPFPRLGDALTPTLSRGEREWESIRQNKFGQPLVLRQERLLTEPPWMLSLIASFIFAYQGGHEMAQLIVRNLDPELVQQLKIRAAQHGCSMEAEHREILRQVLQGPAPEETLKALLLAMPLVGDDADFTRLPDQGREVEV